MDDRAKYFELANDGLIAFSGEDAGAFLHGQLTCDVAGLRAPAARYAGYCTPKGRLLATFLLWRLHDEIVLQLPASLRISIQTRLAKYILRAKVKIADGRSQYALFGFAGERARDALAACFSTIPQTPHQVVVDAGSAIAAIPGDRYVLLAPKAHVDTVRDRLSGSFVAGNESDWRALDVAAGIPIITGPTQEQYVPQMVNLDLLGGVSFDKGCYPGQEIVARTHYLGRLKQRMYRVRVATAGDAAAGDPLYSAEFADQASGAILTSGARDEHGLEALAVLQRSSAEGGTVRHLAPDGAAVEMLSLPYPLPD